MAKRARVLPPEVGLLVGGDVGVGGGGSGPAMDSRSILLWSFACAYKTDVLSFVSFPLPSFVLFIFIYRLIKMTKRARELPPEV